MTRGESLLQGSIPPELGGLRYLRMLRLDNNRLTGPIPRQLGNHRFLRELRLDGNKLTGPVPITLTDLRSLEHLLLANNPLSGRLSRFLIRLPLERFHWHNTDLCAPADARFQEWLDSIPDEQGNRNCDS